MQQEKKRVLVVGGCGFLGRYIVEELLSRGEEVVVFDIRESWKDDRFTFVQGSICELATLEKAFQGVTTVIHTASPPHGCSKKLYFQVNVEGTHNVIAACLKNGVSQLIFTSSASVVFDGHDIKVGDESLPYCKKHLDPYSRTKELAERAVLDANGTQGKDGVPLLTVALRPSGIFGPGDQQAWPGFIDAAKNGKSKYQLGDGKNIMDWTYVENIAYAHVLASEKLTASNKDVAGQVYIYTSCYPLSLFSSFYASKDVL
ncbi:erg26, C-3 sterol dehydrogenase [Balamuthia mandrillaris]